jgi:hypothetical protein
MLEEANTMIWWLLMGVVSYTGLAISSLFEGNGWVALAFAAWGAGNIFLVVSLLGGVK